MPKKPPEPLHLVFTLLGALVLLFIIAPLAGMVLHSSPGEIAEVARDREVLSSIWLTIWTALAATLAFALPAIPLAWLLARREFPLKGLVNGVIDLPVMIPHSTAGIAILGVISREGLLGRTAEQFGLTIVGHPVGIMIAMAFLSIPFLINAARDGFAAVPERFEKVALNLGASPLKVFFTISLPLAWRSILSGMILMCGRGMSEFGAVIIVAYHPMITPVLIYERFTSFGLRYARPVAVLFLTVCLILFIALRLLSRRKADAGC